MKSFGTAVALLALGGCVSAGDMRSRPVIATMTSQKSVAEIAGCLSIQFSKAPAAMNRTITIDRGVSLVQSMQVAGVPTVLSAIDVQDFGPERRVSVRSVGRAPKDPGKIIALYSGCL